MIEAQTPIELISRVGKTVAPKLKKFGLNTARDLLWYLPNRYEDLSEITPIANLVADQKATVIGKITMMKNRRSWKRKMNVTEIQIEDSSGQLQLVWFRSPYVAKILKIGDEIYATGKIKADSLIPQMINPLYEKVKHEQLHAARIIPIYPLTYGITNKQLRFLINEVLVLANWELDILPAAIYDKEKFPDLATALKQIHFPDNLEILKQATARLKFEELLWLQLKILQGKADYLQHPAQAIKKDDATIAEFIKSLPFALTADQSAASAEILKDLNSSKAMNRLLEGDVGSGKTVVAAIAALAVIKQGHQSALMTPTEILARQHFDNFCKYLPDAKIALLTAKQKIIHYKKELADSSKNAILNDLALGDVDFIIGTQSLIQENITFHSLGLAVIDEQHRFGVQQRKTLLNRNKSGLAPHLLSLTATPIPRTLSLTLYGDLDISIIKEKPALRKEIITKVVADNNRVKAYDWILQRIKTGEQLFVVCPLVEDSDKLGVKSVMTEFQRLQQEIYPNLTIKYVHGKLKSEEKKEIIEDFRSNKFPILVASTVIEVGIDIPGATMMLIEGAERFGLAQLHQLRGRIGRNDKQAFCFLFTSAEAPNNIERLNALVKYNDGFKLAEIDLELRGAGDVFGTKQSGLMELQIARLTDTVLIKKARTWAEELLENSTYKKDVVLQAKIKELAEEIHWE